MRKTARVSPLLLLLLAGCSNATPYATTVGLLPPGDTMTVQIAQGTLQAFQPANGEPRNRFTVAATAMGRATAPPPPHIVPARQGILVESPQPLGNLLVRVPDGVTLVVRSQRGDVNVTDISGPARIVAERGNVRVFIREGYAEASTGTGSIDVAMGSASWPGTLRFESQHGDIAISVEDTASFRVHMHTDDGTLFTDFNLRGTSNGGSETIDGAVNGGGPHAIDIETVRGSIRLLRLHAQA